GELQIRGSLDLVLVRHDVTGRIDDETGAETLQGLSNFARPETVGAEELRVKIVDRIANRASNDTLGIDIHDRRQHLRDCQNRWFGGWISLRKTKCRPRENQPCNNQRANFALWERTHPACSPRSSRCRSHGAASNEAT